MPGRSETDTDMRYGRVYGRGGKRRCLGPEGSHCSRFPLRTTYKRSQIREFAPPFPTGGSPRTDRMRTYGLGRRGESTQRQSHTRGVGAWANGREEGCEDTSIWESGDRDTKSRSPTRNTHPATLSTNHAETNYFTGTPSLLAPLLSNRHLIERSPISPAVRAPIVTPDEVRPSQMASGDPGSRF